MAYVRDGILRNDWHVGDVKSLDKRLSRHDCLRVLLLVADNHDANVGINWDVIQFHIDTVKRKEK